MRVLRALLVAAELYELLRDAPPVDYLDHRRWCDARDRVLDFVEGRS